MKQRFAENEGSFLELSNRDVNRIFPSGFPNGIGGGRKCCLVIPHFERIITRWNPSHVENVPGSCAGWFKAVMPIRGIKVQVNCDLIPHCGPIPKPKVISASPGLVKADNADVFGPHRKSIKR